MTSQVFVKREIYVSAAPVILRTWGFLLVQHARTGKVFAIMLAFYLFNLSIKVRMTRINNMFRMNSYHLRCLGPMATDSNHAEVYICPYCQFLLGGSISQNKGGPLVCIYF